MKKSKWMTSIFAVLLAGIMCFAGCGNANDAGAGGGEAASAEGVTIKVGATPAPHAEMLEAVKEELAKKGIALEIVQFTDYIQPNIATSDGELDANFFQHQPYLDDFNAENGTKLVSLGKIHFEPLGIFPGKTATLDALADGAKIAVPNDATNEARALQLLTAQGLFTLKENVGLNATKADIVDNPHNYEIVEVEAAQVARALPDVDIAVINGNYALEAGLNASTDALATEDPNSEAAQTYGNVLVVKEGDENREELRELYAALTSEVSRKFIEEKYQGAVVPVF